MPCDLRVPFAECDRSCPPRTSGSRCIADPARTRAMSYRELGKLPRTTPDGPILQVHGHGHEPWLSVDDCCRPMRRTRRGHGRRDELGSGLEAMAPARQRRPRQRAGANRPAGLPGPQEIASRARGHCRRLGPLFNSWSLSGTRLDGNPVALGATTAEVVQRQVDGSASKNSTS
jgi:hypothetical protein